MIYQRPIYRLFPAFFAAITILSSCKENTLINSNTVPAVDNISVFGTDTLTLLTKSVQDDSVITNANKSGQFIFMGAGNISNDPFFGNTSASFYFQVRPPQDNYSFDKDKFQIDSAVIILPYSGFAFGDTTNSAGTQTFRAFRLTESINYDTNYYAHTLAKSIDGTQIGSTVVNLPNLIHGLRDSIVVAGVKRAPHVRIRVADALMNELISKTGSSDYTNTLAFIAYFKGIFITTDAGGNTIPYFRLDGSDNFSKAGILMYYHTKNSGGIITDTLTASYPFDATASQTKTAFFNRVTRDYTGSPAKALFNSTAVSDNTIILQNLPGAAIDLRIPNVKNLPPCIVNKAELIITQIPSPLSNIYALPVRVYPEVIDEYGNRLRIADRNPTTSSAPLLFIDGNLRVGNIGGILVNQYVLNFPRELQNAIVGQKKELRLRINGTQSFIGAFRLTAAGSTYSQPAYRMKLNIVYTKL